MDTLVFTSVNGDAFDLNYYILTSNTEQGGGPATGNEDTYIIASIDGVTESFRQKLPSEDWGIDVYREIYLGPEFDGIKSFWFDSEGGTYCFGMDKFYVDLAPPEPSTPNPVIVGSGTVEDAIAPPPEPEPEPVAPKKVEAIPVNSLWMLMLLSGGLVWLGSRKKLFKS